MNFQHEIETWDGKTVAALDDLFARYGRETEFVATLIAYLEQPILQVGASWLIKKVAESDRAIPPNEVHAIYALLPQLEAWQTKLHILQSIPFLPISDNQKSAVEAFLRACLLDKNKFVRAWAYNGFYELARQHTDYHDEMMALFDRALHEEAASVKARIRNLLT